jgi:hypothetical protein
LDSKSIYAASDSLKHNVNWLRVSDETEWIYFGAGDDVNQDVALQKVTEYFPDSIVAVAIDRKSSIMVPTNDLHRFLSGILGIKTFLIWDQTFKRVMEFSSIGVMRQGYI